MSAARSTPDEPATPAAYGVVRRLSPARDTAGRFAVSRLGYASPTQE